MKSECAKRKEFAERLKACIWCVVSIKKEPVLSPTGEIGRHRARIAGGQKRDTKPVLA